MTTATIVTIIVIAFLIFFIILGWCKGFLRMILSMLSLLVTLVIAAFLLTPVSEYLAKNTEIETTIEKHVEAGLGWQQKSEDAKDGDTGQDEEKQTGEEQAGDDKKRDSEKKPGAFDLEKILAALKEAGIDIPIDLDAEQLPEYIEQAEQSDEVSEKDKTAIENAVIEGLKLPTVVKTAVLSKNNVSEYIRLGVDSFKQYVIKSLSMIALKILTYVALVIVIFIIIRILLLISKALNRIPIVRGINRFFGAVVGFIEASLILWIICLIISLISNGDFGKQIVDVIEQSRFLSYIYEENLVLRLVDAFFSLF